MKITEKQHRDQLTAAGLPAEDIDTLCKAKAASGAYVTDEEGDDDAFEKAMAKYADDLAKAETITVRDFTVREPDSNATNPETRPPLERTDVPTDIDDTPSYDNVTDDIVKAAMGEFEDVVKGALKATESKLDKALAAFGQIAKAVTQQTVIIKGQGELIKAQGAAIDKLRKAGKRSAESDQRAAHRTPAGNLPAFDPAAYTTIPEPGQRAQPAPALDRISDALEKAIGDISDRRANPQVGDTETFETYQRYLIALADPSNDGYVQVHNPYGQSERVSIATIAKAVGVAN